MSGLWINDIFSFPDFIHFSRREGENTLVGVLEGGNKVVINQAGDRSAHFSLRLKQVPLAK